MLHIILFILKLLGLLILILLGLIILAVLLVLLVPVKYRGEGSFLKKWKGIFKISWMLHILSVTVRYDEDVLIEVRLFGFQILKPKKVDEELKEAEEIMVHAMEVKEPEVVKEVKHLGQEVKQTVLGESKQDPPVFGQTEKNEKKPWLKSLFLRIKKKLLYILERFRFIYLRICDTLKNIKEKEAEIHAFLTNRENQKTAKLLYKQAKRLIRHGFFRKGHGEVTFGFEDPGLTGEVLMAVSVLYPFFHKHWEIYPVFDHAVFAAEGTFQGRIRLGTVLIIGLRMFLDKNFRILLKKWFR